MDGQALLEGLCALAANDHEPKQRAALKFLLRAMEKAKETHHEKET